jgi:hypothetical protein
VTRAEYTEAARARADLLYRGEAVAHRSCGIALAETFGLPGASYQALRRGGLTGEGTCGALQGGLLVLGELLGDPDPAGPPTPALRAAATAYRDALRAALPGSPEDSCNTRTAAFAEFASAPRARHCTALAATAAAAVAGVLWDLGRPVPLPVAPTR